MKTIATYRLTCSGHTLRGRTAVFLGFSGLKKNLGKFLDFVLSRG